MRGSGKGVAIDSTAEKLYNKGFLILHIWGARDFENLYWAINKDCHDHYKKMNLIAGSFFEKSSLRIKERCLAKGMTAEDYSKYLEIMKNEKMINQVGNALVLLEKGHELHNGVLLHCKCFKTHPITWAVPDYVDVNQETLDKFNQREIDRHVEYYKDWNEYHQAWIDDVEAKYIPEWENVDATKIVKTKKTT